MAPRSTASAAWTWPSLTRPGTQQKRSPGTTRRLSCEIPPTSTEEGSPTDSITSMSSKRRFMGTRWHGGTDSVACLGHPCDTAAMGV